MTPEVPFPLVAPAEIRQIGTINGFGSDLLERIIDTITVSALVGQAAGALFKVPVTP